MPDAARILDDLTRIANASRGLAAFWHVAVAVALLALIHPKRPRAALAAWLAALPLVSAAVIAFTFASLFNAIVLGIAAIALGALTTRIPVAPVRWGPIAGRLAGSGMVAYALAYPHFVPVRGWGDLLFTPAGVLPCPSLALTVGLALLAGGFGHRAWSLTLAGVAGFYALFGVLALGVWLDVGLLIGAVALAIEAFAVHHAHAQRSGAALAS